MKYVHVKLAIIIITAFSINGINNYAKNIEPKNNYQDKINEYPMRIELLLKIGSDKENEDFFRPESFDIDQEGRIFILDSGNMRIQCFTSEGKYSFTFGRGGQGPGELSSGASKIRILEDGNIYIIDNLARRINAYDMKGQFIFMGKINSHYGDIVLNNKKYYFSDIVIEENHLPIHLSSKLGEIDRSFGVLIEPSNGIFQRILRLKYPMGLHLIFEDWPYLSVNSKKEIIYSQRLPYRIIKYDSEGQIQKDMTGKVEYDTQNIVEVYQSADGEERGIRWIRPLPYIFPLKIDKDDSILVPFINPEKDYFYIDKYDSDLGFISRYKAAIKIVDNKKNDYIKHAHIDKDNNLYFLVVYEEDPAQLIKYKIIFDENSPR